MDEKRIHAARELLGMPILSIKDGMPVTSVRGILLDGENKCAAALICDKKRYVKDERLLPFAAIQSLGEDAITVPQLSSIERSGSSAEWNRLLRRQVQLHGARVFTEGGRTLGQVEEYWLDAAGVIVKLELSGGKLFSEHFCCEGRHIIAIAPHTLMLRDEAIAELLEQPPRRPLAGLMEKAESAATAAGEAMRQLTAGIGGKLRREEQEEAAEDAPQEEAAAPDAEAAAEAAPTEEAAVVELSPAEAPAEEQTDYEEKAAP
ncbi:MAG: PRC-barrel domain-containing protein [Firmicutes bacterium]|nr:PRC-barrel domain-containing protein [Bacillota bacterium]